MEDTTFEPFKGHTLAITCLAYSPHDGAFLATGSDDKTIRIWDAATGRQVWEPLEGHTGEVFAIAYSPDGQRLVSGSDDKSLRIWDTNTHRTIMGPLEGHTSWIWAVQYSPDGALIASGGLDDLLKLWTARDGDCIATFEHPTTVNSVSFSPSGEHVATACDDSQVRIFAVDGLELLCELSGHRDWVRSVQYSPDGSVIASASGDRTIRLWDPQSGQLVQGSLRGHNLWVTGIAFSPDGQHLVSCSADESIRTWSATSGESKCLAGPLYGHRGQVEAICCSPDRKHFASCSAGGVLVWSIDNGKQMLPQPIDKDNDDLAERYKMKTYDTVRAIAWFSDGRHFASAGDNYAIKTWDAHTGQEVEDLRIWCDDKINDIDISRTDELLASGEDNSIISIWDLKHENNISKRLSGHDGRVLAVRFTPDGERLASGGADSTIRVWNVQSGASLHVIDAHSNLVRTLSISKDGSHLASGSDDETVRVWDLDSYEAIGQPMKHKGAVLSVCFAPDGSRVLSGSEDNTVRLWGVSRREQVFVVEHEDRVSCVRFSTDGSKFLSASGDERVCVWEASTRKLIKTLQHGNHPVSDRVESTAFSPNGTRIVSGTYGGDLRLRDVKAGRLLLPKDKVGTDSDNTPSKPDGRCGEAPMLDSDMESFMERSAAPQREHEVYSAAFSPDGTRIVSGTIAGDLRLWNVKSGRLLLPKRLGGDGAGTDDHPSKPENHGAKSGNSQGDSDVDSFLGRPAFPQRMRDFLVDNDHEDIPPEAGDVRAENSGFNPLRGLRRFWDHARSSRREMNEDPNDANNITTHDRLKRLTSELRQFWNRTRRDRGRNTADGQGNEEGRESHRMQRLRRPRRVSAIIYPAQAEARYVAAGEPPTWRDLFAAVFPCVSPRVRDSSADAREWFNRGQSRQAASVHSEASSARTPTAGVPPV